MVDGREQGGDQKALGVSGCLVLWGVAPAAAGWGRGGGGIELTTTVWKQSATADLGVEEWGARGCFA